MADRLKYTSSTTSADVLGYTSATGTSDEQALAKVISRFHTYYDYAKLNYHDRWDKYWMQYRSKILDEKAYPHQANMFIPYSFTAVETAIPRVVEAIFSADPMVAVKAVNKDDEDNALVLEQLLEYQYRVMKFFRTCLFMLKDLFVVGSCYGKVDWKRTWKSKKKIKKVTSFDEESKQEIRLPELDIAGKPVVEKKKILTYDDPYVYYVDPYKFLMQPGADPVDPIGSSEAVIMITQDTFGNLKDLEAANVYKNIDKLKSFLGKSTTVYEGGQNRYTDMDIQSPSQVSDPYSQIINLKEYWEDEWVIVVAEDSVVIRNEENPYFHCRKPFVETRVCPVPNEIYGIGLMEMVESLQHELNDIRNQRMDNIKLALDKMYVVAEDAEIDLDLLINQPGGVIVSTYIDGIKELVTNDVTQSSFSEARDIKEEIDRAHGQHDPARGKPTARETATAVMSLQEAADMRFKLMAMCASELLSDTSEIIVDLDEQYISGEKIFRITGGQYIKIEDIDELAMGSYDYEPSSASMEGLTKFAKLQQLANFRPLFADNERFNKSAFDLELMKLMNYKKPELYFYSDEQMSQQYNQKAMAQMFANPGMGGIGPSMGASQSIPPVPSASAPPVGGQTPPISGEEEPGMENQEILPTEQGV